MSCFRQSVSSQSLAVHFPRVFISLMQSHLYFIDATITLNPDTAAIDVPCPLSQATYWQCTNKPFTG